MGVTLDNRRIDLLLETRDVNQSRIYTASFVPKFRASTLYQNRFMCKYTPARTTFERPRRPVDSGHVGFDRLVSGDVPTRRRREKRPETVRRANSLFTEFSS